MRPSTLLLSCISSPTLAKSIKETLDNVGPFSHWYTIMKPFLDELEEMSQNRPVTILVPESDAVDKWKSTPEFTAATDDKLRDLLRYHVVKGSHKTDEIAEAGPFLSTMLEQTGVSGGQRLQVEKASESERGINFFSGFGRKSTIHPFGDYLDEDGLIFHAIDRVLTIPPSMSDAALAAGLTSVLGAATKINLDWWSDDDATYFLPNNEAMRTVGSAINAASDEELQNILIYHCLNHTVSPLYTSGINSANWTTAQGEKVFLSYGDQNSLFVNSAEVVHPDILVRNGVVHIIDQVMNPNNADSRQAGSSPFGLAAFPNATASGKAPFADMIRAVSKYHLEAGPKNAPLGALAKVLRE